MARVTVEDCIDKVENRFDLLLLASHRARAVSSGAQIHVARDGLPKGETFLTRRYKRRRLSTTFGSGRAISLGRSRRFGIFTIENHSRDLRADEAVPGGPFPSSAARVSLGRLDRGGARVVGGHRERRGFQEYAGVSCRERGFA